jgi:hypothetical protein
MENPATLATKNDLAGASITPEKTNSEHNQTLRDLRRVKIAIRKAVVESKRGYQFNANSYSFSARNACIAAEQALDEVLSQSIFPVRGQMGDESGSAPRSSSSLASSLCWRKRASASKARTPNYTRLARHRVQPKPVPPRAFLFAMLPT